MHQTIFTL